MKTYMCWAPDFEDEAAARKFLATSWAEAAESFAHRNYHDEQFDELRVHVRCANGALWSVDVEVEMELSLYLGSKKKIEDAKQDNASAEDKTP